MNERINVVTNFAEISYIQNQRDTREVVINHFRKDLKLMIEGVVEVMGDKPYYEIVGIFINVLANVYKHRYKTITAAARNLGIQRSTLKKHLETYND